MALLVCMLLLPTVLCFQGQERILSALEYARAPGKGPLPESCLGPEEEGPEQFKLATSGGGMRVSWITLENLASGLYFGSSPDALHTRVAEEARSSYSCTEKSCGGPYQSGFIHVAHLEHWEPGMTYYYRVDGGGLQSFVMPPSPHIQPDPIAIALIGDLGQTADSNNTVQHLRAANASLIVHAGDLSYADCYQPRWDTYGRLMDPLSSHLAWMTVSGNHEEESTERCGKSLNNSFAAYNARYGSIMPFKESGSDSPQYYSFETAGIHFVMLGSYVGFASDTKQAAQLAWLKSDLASINKSMTPWLVAVLHAPWYNSNTAHQHEKEEIEMRSAMEQMLFDAGLDAMFAGHVHAYERSYRVFQEKLNHCGAQYINIGDGGNREGLASRYLEQPAWSAHREASFGHGLLTVHNTTHVHFTWHRDQDGERVISDETWLVKDPACKRLASN